MKMVLTKKVKTAIILTAVALALVAAAIIVLISARNAERAEVIYQGFLGNLFYGSITNDDGYAAAAERDDIDPDKVYWENYDSTELAFAWDGTIQQRNTHKMSALSYPGSFLTTPKDEGMSHTYDMDFSTFDVEVSLAGKVYLCIGSGRYEVETDERANPQRIHYKDMVLANQGAWGQEG